MKTNIILQGDALTQLKTLPDESIDCVMTSPPYWALRDYGVEGQLGLEPTFEEYINDLCDIFDEVKRVLKKSGTCWVNLGDTYYGSGKGAGGDLEKSKETYIMPKGWNRPSREAFKESSITKNCLVCEKVIETGVNGQFCSRKCLNTKGNDFRSQNRQLPDKTLTMIPFRFAIEMVNRGWILRNNIIWKKNNCMPSSVKDRFTVDFEYLFFFVKNKKYYFEQQFEPHIWARKDKRSRVVGGVESKGKSSTGKYATSKVAYGVEGKNKRTVWKINTKPFKESHFATYPEELVETPLKAGCPEGGVVLDPFFGSGTTGVVAWKQNKNFIGIELNESYISIAKKRLEPYLTQSKLKDFAPLIKSKEVIS